MNNFPKSQENFQDPKYIAPLLNVNNPPPLYLQNFHKSNTSPLPVVTKWNKSKVPLSETILSNRHYVIACSVFTSFIIVIMLVKLAIQVLLK